MSLEKIIIDLKKKMPSKNFYPNEAWAFTRIESISPVKSAKSTEFGFYLPVKVLLKLPLFLLQT